MVLNFKMVFCLAILTALIGCGYDRAPGIVYNNFSKGGGVVKNIKVKWNQSHLPESSSLGFCGVNANSYSINYKESFGPIHVEWENAKGEKINKDLVLTKEKFPNIKARKAFLSSVYLFFTQDDVYLYTSDTPNLEQIEADLYKKAGLTCQEYRDRENKRLWGTTNSDDPIEIYEAIPNDSPLKKDPKFIEEYKKEKAKRAKK